MKPIHPGEVLLKEFINLTFGGIVNFFDDNEHLIRSEEDRLYFRDLIEGEVSIDEFHANTLSYIYNTKPSFWIGLQRDYDKEMKEDKGRLKGN
jgi:plasmid maintenance system antidote protein VapI